MERPNFIGFHLIDDSGKMYCLVSLEFGSYVTPVPEGPNGTLVIHLAQDICIQELRGNSAMVDGLKRRIEELIGGSPVSSSPPQVLFSREDQQLPVEGWPILIKELVPQPV